jgi:hypothetical protein
MLSFGERRLHHRTCQTLVRLDTIRFVMGFEHLLSNRRAEPFGHLALVICVGLIALAAVGCGSSDKKWPIVGRWALEGGVIKSVPQFVVYQDDQT